MVTQDFKISLIPAAVSAVLTDTFRFFFFFTSILQYSFVCTQKSYLMEHYVVLEKKFNPYNFYIYNINIALDIDMNIKVLIQTQKVVLSFEVCLFGLFSHDYTQFVYLVCFGSQ